MDMGPIRQIGNSLIDGANALVSNATDNIAKIASSITSPSTVAPKSSSGNTPSDESRHKAYSLAKNVDHKSTLECLGSQKGVEGQSNDFKGPQSSLGQAVSSVTYKVKQFIGQVSQMHPFLGANLRWQTHMHAEHMSQGELSGNSTPYAMKKTIGVLESMENPPKELIDAMKYGNKIASKLFFHPLYVASPALLAGSIKKDLQNLQPGQSLVIPSCSSGHSMVMMITRQANGNFKVVHFNKGEGINNFHYYRIDANGKRQYQTSFEIEDVKPENLCDPGAQFIEALLTQSQKSTESIYKKCLPMLGGRIAEPSSDPRMWSHSQLGGSCTVACCLALVKSQMNPESYKEFRNTGREQMVFKSFASIQSGWGNNTINRIVTLEVVKKLEHSYDKQDKKLPEELKKIKDSLQEMQKGSVTSVPLDANNRPLVGKNLSENISEALAILKKGNFDAQSLNSSYGFLQAMMNDRKIQSPEDLKSLFSISKSLIEYCKDRPLTKEQIVFMAAFASAISLAISLKQGDPSKNDLDRYKEDIKNAGLFYSDMHERFNGLSLGSLYRSDLVKYVQHFQQHIFTPTSPIAPKALQNMKAAAAA